VRSLDEKKCKVIIRCESGGECCIPVESCCEESDGSRTVVIRCGTSDSAVVDCCPEEDK
jgi:hypothetical protein